MKIRFEATQKYDFQGVIEKIPVMWGPIHGYLMHRLERVHIGHRHDPTFWQICNIPAFHYVQAIVAKSGMSYFAGACVSYFSCNLILKSLILKFIYSEKVTLNFDITQKRQNWVSDVFNVLWPSQKHKVYMVKWAIENDMCHSEKFNGTFLLNSETIFLLDAKQIFEKSV